MAIPQQKPSTYDMWSASARNAYDAMEKRALKAESKLADLENSFTQQIDYLTPTDDTLSWNMVMMRTLNDMLSEAASTLDPSKIFEKVTQTIGIYLDVTSVYICGWNPAQNKITVLAEFINENAGLEENMSDIGISYQFDNDFKNRFKESPDYWLIHHDDDNLQKKERLDYENYGVKTIFYVPMYANGELFGFIEAWDTSRKRNFHQSQVDFVVAVAHQIASSVRMAQLHRSLQESEQRYRMLMDTMQGGVAQTDMNGIIQFVNHHFANMMKIPVVDLIQQNLAELWQRNTTPTEIPDEYFLSDEDGQPQYIQMTHATIPSQTEQALGKVFVYTDITKRKEAEKVILELVLEQERTRLLAQFVQDASHEFYTPLSIINTKLHLLRHYQTEEKAFASLESIQDQAHIIGGLIKTLVQVTTLDSLQDLDLKSHNLVLILEQVMASFEDVATENQQLLTFEITNPKITLFCNVHYIILVLNNLIHNALRYTPEGGTIILQITETEDSIGISIEDNGIGMSKEEQSQIFNRFYRADAAHSTRGFGLGLPIVKRVIDLHHGHIHVESSEGKGTAITIGLPKHLAP